MFVSNSYGKKHFKTEYDPGIINAFYILPYTDKYVEITFRVIFHNEYFNAVPWNQKGGRYVS